MIHLISTHPFVALPLVIFIVALITLVIGGALVAAAERMPEPSDIDLRDFKGIDVTVSTAVELANMGFDVKAWDGCIQITDASGITFYMPKDATVEQCLARYQEKQQQFHAA